MKYDLEERTLKFSKSIINLVRIIPKNVINLPLCDQLIRSATSVGANYREANETDGKKDFKHKILISRREAKESVYWLDLLSDANKSIDMKDEIKESVELLKIISTIYYKS